MTYQATRATRLNYMKEFTKNPSCIKERFVMKNLKRAFAMCIASVSLLCCVSCGSSDENDDDKDVSVNKAVSSVESLESGKL